MTYDEIKEEIASLRFNSGMIGSIGRWVNTAEAKVWTAFDWPFKYVRGYSLAVTANDTSPTLPSDFHKVLKGGLQDDLGGMLQYMAPDEFNSNYVGSSNVATGRPADYTLREGVLYVGPTPDTSYTFKLDYERQLAHKDSNGNVVGGTMSAAADTPIWETPFHFILVPGGMSIGLILVNDPTYGAVDSEFQSQILLMADHYLPPDVPETQQYGADNLGYEHL